MQAASLEEEDAYATDEELHFMDSSDEEAQGWGTEHGGTA